MSSRTLRAIDGLREKVISLTDSENLGIPPDDGRATEVASGYFSTKGPELRDNVRQTIADLCDIEFDTIVCTGLSGLIVASPVAIELAKHLLIVRKSDEGNHGSFIAEGFLGRRWVFVDDFISSGNTFKKVNDAIESICNGKWYRHDDYQRSDFEWDTHCVGIYEYQRQEHKKTSPFQRSQDRPYDVGSRSFQKIKWEDVR